MSQMSHAIDTSKCASYGDTARVLRRTIIIGLTAFLTVVDLFATQAILPSVGASLSGKPSGHEFCRQREHDGDGGRRPLRRLLQPANQ